MVEKTSQYVKVLYNICYSIEVTFGEEMTKLAIEALKHKLFWFLKAESHAEPNII